MKSKAILLLATLIFCNIRLLCQVTCTIIYKDNRTKIIDSMEFVGATKPNFNYRGDIAATGLVSIDSGLFSQVIVYNNAVKTVEFAENIKEIQVAEINGNKTVYESVIGVKLPGDDFSKQSIFMLKLVDGPVCLYQFEGLNPKNSGYIAKENNVFTLFTYNNYYEQFDVFFNDKPKIKSYISKLKQYKELDYNSLDRLIQYVNSSFEFTPEEGDYTIINDCVNDFVSILKTGDNERLKVFCSNVFFDQKSSEYFHYFSQFHYGMPAESPEEYEDFKNRYINRVLQINNKLGEDQKRDKLELVEISASEKLALSNALDIFVQMVYFKLKFGDTDADYMVLSLGKVLYINGVIKTVTLPK